MDFLEIIALPEKERGQPMLELAKSGSDEACVAYAQLIFKDKYKGTQVDGQSKESAKVEARSAAPELLMEAAKRGYLPAMILGKDSTFYGVHGAMFKKLCKTDYRTAIEFIDLLLEKPESEAQKAEALLQKATCLECISSGSDKPWEDIIALLLEASSVEGEFGDRAKVRLGSRAFDESKWDESIELLTPFQKTDLSASAHLVVIYKTHKPDNDKYHHAVDCCRAICESKKK
ncbi:conserved hypothetical protein [Vibrio chagasii]|nr:conserved hypothetical protein [Vibrio chagasii]